MSLGSRKQASSGLNREVGIILQSNVSVILILKMSNTVTDRKAAAAHQPAWGPSGCSLGGSGPCFLCLDSAFLPGASQLQWPSLMSCSTGVHRRHGENPGVQGDPSPSHGMFTCCPHPVLHSFLSRSVFLPWAGHPIVSSGLALVRRPHITQEECMELLGLHKLAQGSAYCSPAFKVWSGLQTLS